MISSMCNMYRELPEGKRKKLEHGVVASVFVVLATAAMTGEMLEIITGLVGALFLYVVKERSPRRPAHVAKTVATPVRKFQEAKPSVVPGCKLTSSLHQEAEPRAQLSFEKGLTPHQEVDQLLRDVWPGRADLDVCDEFARLASPCVRRVIPEAQIDVVAHTSVIRVGCTGYRPELDLVITVPQKVLAQRLQAHTREHAGDPGVRKFEKIMEVDDSVVNKFAIRMVVAQLSFCKLWRTAYRGAEPKVVLLAPRSLGILSEDMHIHVAVNCPNTIRAKNVFNQSDIHVQRLIAFVRRWAQDRCIGNTTYGHMPLYAWSLLVTHFCQSEAESLATKSTIELFVAFIDFCIKFHVSSSQRCEGAAVRIEDPYDTKRNVAASMTPVGMARFKDELERAKKLLVRGSSLLALLEHYNPPVQGAERSSIAEQ